MVTGVSAVRASSPAWIRAVLGANALFSAVSGIEFIAAPGAIADLTGMPAALVAPLGVLVAAYAVMLAFAAVRPAIDRRALALFAILDAAWVVASADLLLTGMLPLTEAGRWAVLIVADIVGGFALMEFLGWRRLR